MPIMAMRQPCSFAMENWSRQLKKSVCGASSIGLDFRSWPLRPVCAWQTLRLRTSMPLRCRGSRRPTGGARPPLCYGIGQPSAFSERANAIIGAMGTSPRHLPPLWARRLDGSPNAYTGSNIIKPIWIVRFMRRRLIRQPFAPLTASAILSVRLWVSAAARHASCSDAFISPIHSGCSTSPSPSTSAFPTMATNIK